MGLTLAFFHDLGYLPSSRDLLKNIRNRTAFFTWDTCNILWLIIAGPDTLFTAKFAITSNISSFVQRMSLIELPVLDSKSVNNLKRNAKEHFEKHLDTIILENE
jgi:hypothetical protein